MDKSNLSYEERLSGARKRLDIDNKIRIISFAIATLFSAVFYSGITYFPDNKAFMAVKEPILYLLLILVLVILVTTFLKFFFIASYNRVIKLHEKGEL